MVFTIASAMCPLNCAPDRQSRSNERDRAFVTGECGDAQGDPALLQSTFQAFGAFRQLLFESVYLLGHLGKLLPQHVRGLRSFVSRFVRSTINLARGRSDLHRSLCEHVFLSHVIAS
jgi:hypothetical protein